MQYASREYIAFLIIVFFAYWLLPERTRLRVSFLLAAGFVFYLAAGPMAIITLAATSSIAYGLSRSMARYRTLKKPLLIVSLAIEFGALIAFKYAMFFAKSAADLVQVLGANAHQPHLRILAPLGISFYSLQLASYTIDVYRGDAEPASSLLEFICFASFFPTIVAGPIVRARQLLPQLKSRVPLTAESGSQALLLIALGIVKKVVIANYLTVNLVDRVFDFPQRFSSLEVLLAIYGYAIVIFADFSGYSDIAIGSAMLLGLKLPDNFNLPYRSRSLPEFWRRWHITFSTWLRDYIFFSAVRGRARNKTALYAGLFITMVLGGLWHGADWTFIAWGALHGAGLAVAHGYPAMRNVLRKALGMKWTYSGRQAQSTTNTGSMESRNPRTWVSARLGTIAKDAAMVFITFHFVCLTWVFFRAESMDQASEMLAQLGRLTTDTSNITVPVLIVLALGYAAHWTPTRVLAAARNGFSRLPAPVQAVLLFVLCIGLYRVASSDVAPFIYARF